MRRGCFRGRHTVYVDDEAGWLRVDVRGNKEGVDVQLSSVAKDSRSPSAWNARGGISRRTTLMAPTQI